MSYWYQSGQTSVIIRVKLYDSSVTTGAGKTGLTGSSAGLIISTIADNEAAATAYTQAASHIQTIATLGTYAAPSASNCRFGEVDSTNHPGIYEIQIANARFAVAGAKSLLVSWSGATNLAQGDIVIPLTGVNPYDGVAFGMSLVPANATQINGVSTSSVTTVNANQGTTQPINFTGTAASALAKCDVTDWNGTAVSAPATAGVPDINVKNWNGTVVATPATAGIPDVNTKKINNIATTPVTTVNANQGTTQPVNFTGTGGSALVNASGAGGGDTAGVTALIATIGTPTTTTIAADILHVGQKSW